MTRGLSLEAKLRHYCDVSETGCWLWKGCLARNGYARLWWKGKTPEAHKLSYLVFKGPIPKGLCVRHTCHVKHCVNPDHLILGTHQDNMDDMVQAGRSCTGCKHSQQKLTPEQVREIRHLRSEGVTYKTLSTKFNIDKSHVYRIVARQVWRENNAA